MKYCKTCKKPIIIRVKVCGIPRTLSCRRTKCIECQPLGDRPSCFRSVIRAIPKDKMALLIANSLSISHLLECLGLPSGGGSYRTLHNYCSELGLDLSGLKGKQARRLKINILIKGSNAKGDRLKNAMLSQGVLKLCAICKQPPIWNGKPLTLQVDHINGDNKDNRLENLRFLCPNCHSQTPTYAGGNRKSYKDTKIMYCITCGNTKAYNKSKMCCECSKMRMRRFNPSTEEFINILKTSTSVVEVASTFKVSDNAIRKRCRVMGIDYKALIGSEVQI